MMVLWGRIVVISKLYKQIM